MIGWWIERLLNRLLARRGQGAWRRAVTILGWLAAFSLFVGIGLAIFGQKWWSGFLVGLFDTLLSLTLSKRSAAESGKGNAG